MFDTLHQRSKYLLHINIASETRVCKYDVSDCFLITVKLDWLSVQDHTLVYSAHEKQFNMQLVHGKIGILLGIADD